MRRRTTEARKKKGQGSRTRLEDGAEVCDEGDDKVVGGTLCRKRVAQRLVEVDVHAEQIRTDACGQILRRHFRVCVDGGGQEIGDNIEVEPRAGPLRPLPNLCWRPRG